MENFINIPKGLRMFTKGHEYFVKLYNIAWPGKYSKRGNKFLIELLKNFQVLLIYSQKDY